MARFLEPDQVRAVVDDYTTAGLEPIGLAVMELADKVARDAASVREADVERLRELGLSDAEIVDVVLAAPARCFFSKVARRADVEPDAKYSELEPGLRDAPVVGRAIAER